jgi:uncharacterized protein YxeA
MKNLLKIVLLILAMYCFAMAAYSQTRPVYRAKKMFLQQPSQADKIEYEAEESIYNSQVLENQQEITQKAGKEIVLTEGFEAREGSIFKAEIVDNLPSSFIQKANFEAERAVLVYPNPSKGLAKLRLDPQWASTQKRLIAQVINSNGEIAFTQVIDNQADTLLDLSQKGKGIYIIKLFANDEEVISKRLVIN